MDYVRVVLVFYLFGIVLTKSAHSNRQQRLFRFGYSHTKTVVRPFLITSVIPSSCVHVEPTLPPCRNVRFYGFPSFGSNSSENTTTVVEDEVQTTPLSWGEYLGLSAPTVTVNVTQISTTTVTDSSVTVTFSLKGCRPQRMPLGLDNCQIQPTPITLPIVPTSTVNPGSNGQNINQETSNQIQGSQADVQPVPSNAATTNLDNANST